MSTLLTVRAAADQLGVAYSTLKQWIYDGSVRTTRTNGGHHRRPITDQTGQGDGRPSTVTNAFFCSRSHRRIRVRQ